MKVVQAVGFVCLFIFSFYAHGQPDLDKKVDSLLNECRRVSNYPDSLAYLGNQILAIAKSEDHLKGFLEGYFAIGYGHFQSGDYETAIVYYDSAISFEARALVDEYTTLTRIIRNKGIAFNRIGNTNGAIESFQYLLRLATERNDPRGKAFAYNELGVTEKNANNFTKAISYYDQALHLWDSLGIDRQLYYIYTNIAIANSALKAYDQAIANFKTAIEFAEESKLDREVANGYNNLAVALTNIGEYDSSIAIIQKSLPFFIQRKLPREEYLAYQNIGKNYLKKSEFDSAEFYLSETLSGFEEINYVLGIVETKGLIGELYLSKDQFEEAIVIIDEGLNLAIESNLKYEFGKLYNQLAKAYEGLGDFKNANLFLKFEERIKDSLYSIENVKTINEIVTRYEVDEKNRLIEVAQQERRFYKSLVFQIGFLALLIGLLAIWLYWKFYLTKQEVLLKEDELEELRKEIEKIRRKSAGAASGQLIHLKSKATLPLDELMYVHSDGHYLEFYLDNRGKPEIDRNTMTDILGTLPVNEFVRVHKSYIVNIRFIRILNSTQLMLDNGQWIKLSRTYKPALKEIIKKGALKSDG
ncbi:MAG: LytTR family transcriptional regulator [Cyclobacteriaceae bacterium]